MKTKVKKDYKSAVKHALTGETTGRDLGGSNCGFHGI